MKPNLNSVLSELASRKERSEQFKLEDRLFDKQLAFVQDKADFKVGICSRRSGKSTGIAADLIHTAKDTPDCTALYITGTRADAKKIIWGELLKVNRDCKFGGEPNISELSLTLPNGSIVRLSGAKDENEVNKLRGQLPPVKKAFIDEAQKIRDSILTILIDDVLEASLLDYAGTLVLTGTPGPIPSGYFYRICHNLDEHYNPLPENQWSVHAWTFFDNPFIAVKSGKTHQQLLDRVLKRRGIPATDPSIQREYFGKWVLDTDSLVYKYNASKNDYKKLPDEKFTYIMGVDLGFNDADAIAVLAWNDLSATTYLVEEKVTTKQGITELVEQIEALRKKYDCSKIVVDQGGLGKKIAEEITRRHNIPVEAADKARKVEHIELLNDAMRKGSFKAKADSLFAQDSLREEWDLDKSTPDKKVVSKKFHSDICDAVLYAWFKSYSFTYTPPVSKAKQGSPQWLEELEQQALEHFLKQEEANEFDPFK